MKKLTTTLTIVLLSGLFAANAPAQVQPTVQTGTATVLLSTTPGLFIGSSYPAMVATTPNGTVYSLNNVIFYQGMPGCTVERFFNMLHISCPPYTATFWLNVQ